MVSGVTCGEMTYWPGAAGNRDIMSGLVVRRPDTGSGAGRRLYCTAGLHGSDPCHSGCSGTRSRHQSVLGTSQVQNLTVLHEPRSKHSVHAERRLLRFVRYASHMSGAAPHHVISALHQQMDITLFPSTRLTAGSHSRIKGDTASSNELGPVV